MSGKFEKMFGLLVARDLANYDLESSANTRCEMETLSSHAVFSSFLAQLCPHHGHALRKHLVAALRAQADLLEQNLPAAPISDQDATEFSQTAEAHCVSQAEVFYAVEENAKPRRR